MSAVADFASGLFGNGLAARRGGVQPRTVQIILSNRQRRVRFDVEWLRQFAAMALAECMRHSGDGLFALKGLPGVEVAVVSDAVIAGVHRKFMNVPGATDVITFDHGELVLSADTAKRYAAEHGHGVVEELALYVVHGLLHLNGFDDREPKARARMHRVQNRVWRGLLAKLAALPKKQPCKVRGEAV